MSRAYQQSADLDDAREHLKKFQYITQNKIGAPMSLAYGEQGQYSRAVESPSAVLKAPAQIKVRFVDVTKEAGIVSTGQRHRARMACLVAGRLFLDYDNDGKLDLFLGGEADRQAELALYHNLGNGKFRGRHAEAWLDPAIRAIGCTAGDYDNDGASDIAVSTAGGVLLLHNEKNGSFEDVTEPRRSSATALQGAVRSCGLA